MTDHTVIVLVSCTNAKRKGTHTARRLYDVSTYFRKQRAYAESVGDVWYVQSAKHGLVYPDDQLADYDQHAGDLPGPETWGERIASSLAGRHDPPATVYLLGGSNYTEPLVPALERRGFDAVTPLHGMKIGERMKRLTELTAAGKQTTADEWVQA